LILARAEPIIVSALFGAEDHRWLDGERKRHFPPERNWLDAHLTLFHHLPPSIEPELLTRLSALCRASPPEAEIISLMSLGRGVAYRVRSEALLKIRAELADAFARCLTPQDQAGWRPHVTVQNKASPPVAKALLADLERSFQPRALCIKGLAAWRYVGGPWERIKSFDFRPNTR
jgi:2'-5' RNA ligase superfamily